MTENKYEKAFYEWVRLGDRFVDLGEGDDSLRLLKTYQETAKEFEVAFEKAEKWDKLIEALSKGIIDKDDLVDLEYGPEELQSSTQTAKNHINEKG